MSRVATVVVVALAVALSGGCGTVFNLAPGMLGKREVYGGVRFDVEEVRGFADGSAILCDNPSLALRAYMTSLVALDLPLSAMGDTLTLPLTLAFAISQQSSAEAKGTAADRTADTGTTGR